MSKNKFGIIASMVFALSIVLSPVASACSLNDLSSCDNDGLMALVVQLLAAQQPTTPPVTTPVVSGLPAGFQFNTNLKLGSTGNDVKYLQIFLNSDPATSVGNAGSETTYFGSMTQAAVVKFQNKYASEVLTPYGLSAGTGFFGTSSRAKANAMIGSVTTTTPTTLPAGCTSTTGFSTTTGQRCDSGVSVVLPTGCTSTAGFSPVTGERCDSGAVVSGTPTTGAGMTVAVASGSPTGTTLVEKQAIAPLAKYTLVNSDSVEAKITKVELQRTGVSGDTTLKNVYLYDGDTRLTDAATISQGKVTFNNPNGVIVIPAGTSKVITVVSDIDTGTSGQTVGVSLTGLTANVDIKSTMPVTGGIQTIANAALAGVAVGVVTPGPGSTSIDAGTSNYTIFSAPLTITTRNVNLKGVSFKMIGSIPTDALENIQLYVNGVAAGNATVIDSNNMVRFNLATPVELRSGNTVEVRANIVKGSSRNFSFSLENAADLVVVDSVYNVNVLATGIPATTGTVNINFGAVSVTKDSTFNATSVTAGVVNATLAKYSFKAFGEDVKVNYLKVKSSKALDNMTVYVNGAPVTSSQAVANDNDVLTFSLGSSLIIPAGTTTSVEIRGDTRKGANNLSGSVLVTLVKYGANNAQGVTSSQMIEVPAVDIQSTDLTVGSDTVTIAASTAFAPTGAVSPNSADQKIGSYIIQANDTEGIRINNVNVLIDSASTTNINSFSSLYIKYGSNQSGSINPQIGNNNFPVTIELAANQSITIDVYVQTSSSTATGSTVGMSSTNLTGGADLASSFAQLSTATLANSAGTYAVTINGSYYYATAFSSTLEGTVDALVSLVNADTSSHGITASNPDSPADAMLLTGAANGTAFTVTNVGSLPSNNVAISTTAGTVGSAATSATGTITITGTAIVCDIVKATIGGTDYSYTVTPGNTSDTQVATRLAAVIDAAGALNAVTGIGGTNVITVTATAGAAGNVAVSTSVVPTGGTIKTKLGISGTGISSNVSISTASGSETAGQTRQIISPTLDAPILAVSSSPSAQYVLAGSEGTIAQFNFKSTNGNVTVNELKFTFGDGVASITVGGQTRQTSGSDVTISGLNELITAGYSGKNIPVTVNYHTVGIGGAETSNTDAKVTLTQVKYTSGNETKTLAVSGSNASNTMKIVGGVPTAVLSSSTRTGLTTARTLLAEVTVGALKAPTPNGGQIAVQEIPLTISKSAGLMFGGSNANPFLVKVKGSTSDLGTVSGTVADGKVTFTTPYVIDAGKTTTFEISAVVSDLGSAPNPSITVELGTAANFKWKDVSGDISNLTGELVAGYQTGNTTLIKVSN